MTTAPESALESLLPVAIEAAAIANDLMLTRAPGLLTDKDDRDVVSEVDFAVERALREHLRAKTPDIAVLGEEEGVTGDVGGELLWAIDPIDGTANFVHGVPLCGMSLGLVRDRHPVLGVIDLPFLGARYHAVEHGGAFRGDRPIRAASTGEPSQAIVALGDYAVGEGAEHKNRFRFALTARLVSQVHRMRMLGSAAIDLAWVAEGKLDISVSLSNLPWDTAAGVIIAREAGALVLDADGTEHTLDSAATIAVAPALAEYVIDAIRATGAEFHQGRTPN
jgi:myo-inositol-1(or 4)-monophosphatase